MANTAAKQDSVTDGADELMRKLLNEGRDTADIELAVTIMQTATRYIAIKARINIPDDGNAFDDWRSRGAAAARDERGIAAGSGDDRLVGPGAVRGAGGPAATAKPRSPHKRTNSARAQAEKAAATDFDPTTINSFGGTATGAIANQTKSSD